MPFHRLLVVKKTLYTTIVWTPDGCDPENAERTMVLEKTETVENVEETGRRAYSRLSPCDGYDSGYQHKLPDNPPFRTANEKVWCCFCRRTFPLAAVTLMDEGGAQ